MNKGGRHPIGDLRWRFNTATQREQRAVRVTLPSGDRSKFIWIHPRITEDDKAGMRDAVPDEAT